MPKLGTIKLLYFVGLMRVIWYISAYFGLKEKQHPGPILTNTHYDSSFHLICTGLENNMKTPRRGKSNKPTLIILDTKKSLMLKGSTMNFVILNASNTHYKLQSPVKKTQKNPQYIYIVLVKEELLIDSARKGKHFFFFFRKR